MRKKSNIGKSLEEKRKKSFIKKSFFIFIFILFFISLGILGLTNQKVRIQEVVIKGNSSVNSFDILKFVNNELYKNYLMIIPTDNILLLRRSNIEKNILDNLKKIKKVDISVDDINKIKITVEERKEDNIWCKGSTFNLENCYFMDLNGLVFDKIKELPTDSKHTYFGLIESENPIGQYYFKDIFSVEGNYALNGKNSISNLYNALESLSFKPQYFYALNKDEYKVVILGGGFILLNNKKSFESSLTNLQALVADKYIGNDEESLKKIKYIDLRFGNKVNFELN